MAVWMHPTGMYSCFTECFFTLYAVMPIMPWGVLNFLNFVPIHASLDRVSHSNTGWPHSSQNEIPCVFPMLQKFSLRYFYVKTSN